MDDFDALDGRIARLIKGTSDFGKELDSLTDFVSFGIAPALIIYFWELNTFGKLGWTITLLYSVCCVLRLARFNLTNINKNEVWKMNYFEGIPSPIGAILILLPLIYEISDLKQFFNPKILVPYITILVSIMLISKIPTFSFKKISFLEINYIYFIICRTIICFFNVLYF